MLDSLELDAGISQAGDLNNGGVTDEETGAPRQRKQIYVASGDIFAHLAGSQLEAGDAQFIVELCVNEMNLSQVWSEGPGPHSGAMLHRFAFMNVTFDTKTPQ